MREKRITPKRWIIQGGAVRPVTCWLEPRIDSMRATVSLHRAARAQSSDLVRRVSKLHQHRIGVLTDLRYRARPHLELRDVERRAQQLGRAIRRLRGKETVACHH